MNRYYSGTSAYKLEEYELQTHKVEQEKRERKKNSVAEQKAFCRTVTACVLFVFLAASALVYVNVMAMRASTDIDNLKKQLAVVVDDNKQKEIEINQKLDMKVIEKKAIEELGMQKPDNSQIVYVDIKKENHIEVTANNNKSNPFVEGIKGFWQSIVEYFG